MTEHEKAALSQVRLEHAVECLSIAKKLHEHGEYKTAANRVYYAVFHAMRAVLTLDEIDRKRHSGLISEFNRLYLRTGCFDKRYAKMISALFDMRGGCDYDDFYIISISELQNKLGEAETFVQAVKDYLKQRETDK